MADTDTLQDEINTLLEPSVPHSAQPQITPVAPVATQPINSENYQPIQGGAQEITQPAVDTPHVSPLVPPIEKQVDYSESFESNFTEKKSKSILPLIAVLLLLIGSIVAFFLFRKNIFGPLTYSDCLQTAGSTRVDLEPKYCVTPEGKMFFENKKGIPEAMDAVEAPFNSETIPTSDPPN